MILIYGAYLTLRYSVADEKVRAKVSAIYALLNVLTVPFLVFVIPRLYFSLHLEPVINASGGLQMDSVILIVLVVAVLDAILLFVLLMRKRI